MVCFLWECNWIWTGPYSYSILEKALRITSNHSSRIQTHFEYRKACLYSNICSSCYLCKYICIPFLIIHKCMNKDPFYTIEVFNCKNFITYTISHSILHLSWIVIYTLNYDQIYTIANYLEQQLCSLMDIHRSLLKHKTSYVHEESKIQDL